MEAGICLGKEIRFSGYFLCSPQPEAGNEAFPTMACLTPAGLGFVDTELLLVVPGENLRFVQAFSMLGLTPALCPCFPY